MNTKTIAGLFAAAAVCVIPAAATLAPTAAVAAQPTSSVAAIHGQTGNVLSEFTIKNVRNTPMTLTKTTADAGVEVDAPQTIPGNGTATVEVLYPTGDVWQLSNDPAYTGSATVTYGFDQYAPQDVDTFSATASNTGYDGGMQPSIDYQVSRDGHADADLQSTLNTQYTPGGPSVENVQQTFNS